MPAADLDARYQQTARLLAAHGQQHLLRFYDELNDRRRDELLGQIQSQDWEALDDLIARYVVDKPQAVTAARLEPAPYYAADPSPDDRALYEQARQRGRSLISEGKVAAFTVAGGQGTRLGYDGPKGAYPATPVTNKPLFQLFAESILKTQRKYGRVVPWYIMTSPVNDAPTRAFFERHDYFGLDASHVMFFPQGMVPSFSPDGKALLADKDAMATNPDGHGGSLRALHTSGALDDMARRGIEQISYFQVDNPMVMCVDPLFIGLHALNEAQMSSKMVLKSGPLERVGNFCLADGRVTVIEYSDLPDELAMQTNADGSLRFNAGSIAIHVIAVEFVRALNRGRFALPWHRAEKKVPHIDVATGQFIEPTTPNAVKLETFVFDALPLCERSIILETKRHEEFGPIKNAEGSDSPATSRQLQSARARRWLRAAGVEVDESAVVELSPLTAVEPDDLREVNLPMRIAGGKVVL